MTTLKADMADHLDLQNLKNMEQATGEKVKTLPTELSAGRTKKLRKITQAPSKIHRQTRSTFQTSSNNSSPFQDTATHNIISKNQKKAKEKLQISTWKKTFIIFQTSVAFDGFCEVLSVF